MRPYVKREVKPGPEAGSEAELLERNSARSLSELIIRLHEDHEVGEVDA